MLAAKVDNGASRAITQFFFDNSAFLRYLDRVRARGITVPIVPGILPVTNFARVKEFAYRCGATIPAAFARRFEGLDDDPETTRLVAVATASEQVEALRREGIRHFHFYTLNRADLVYAICRMLGLGETAAAAA
jgi:methylenetetrahydrofolate reductase (NADPH)